MKTEKYISPEILTVCTAVEECILKTSNEVQGENYNATIEAW